MLYLDLCAGDNGVLSVWLVANCTKTLVFIEYSYCNVALFDTRKP